MACATQRWGLQPWSFLAAPFHLCHRHTWVTQQGEESHRIGGTSAAQTACASTSNSETRLIILTLFLLLLFCWITVLSQQCVPGYEPLSQSHRHDQESSHPPEPEVHSTQSREVCVTLCILFTHVCAQKLGFFHCWKKAQPHTPAHFKYHSPGKQTDSQAPLSEP